jgi:two-component system cit operon sensor histidine kinase CitA
MPRGAIFSLFIPATGSAAWRPELELEETDYAT